VIAGQMLKIVTIGNASGRKWVISQPTTAPKGSGAMIGIKLT
jgi:hypothetical protein